MKFGQILMIGSMALASVSTNSYAADVVTGGGYASCTCETAPISSSEVLGTVVARTGGMVMYSGMNGYEKAGPGAKLMAGSEVSAGPGSSAVISVGRSCSNIAIHSNQVATISQQGGPGTSICVNVSDAGGAMAAGSSTGSVSPLVVLGIGAAVVGGVILLGGRDQNGSD